TIPSTVISNILTPRRVGGMILCPPDVGKEACRAGNAGDEPLIMEGGKRGADKSTRLSRYRDGMGNHGIWAEEVEEDDEQLQE
ncbi:hypothetical protein ACJ72_08760, partial [Emergomyces africanus]